ncbi:cysteine-rich protein 2-binding protein [Hippocampus zosterae]|uniref:cysteine-rich protein 2-binding protein n=1 Tax=Hippocampus zosterae TaxID=109293 RepID=UPI00223DB2B4|nr:cysteine-rich protein 2-binding protein [Hippocampus zosterae]
MDGGGVEDQAARASASQGLEEGEVEGETLLIVESEERGSPDLSHDHSGDSLASDPGEEADAVWACDHLAFYCERCHKWIPAARLHGNQPSYLKGDNFFKFVCRDCSEDGEESFERMRLTWQQVVMLAMYNLSLEGTGRQGYFRWKEDICAFIGRHWNFLLGSRKKTSTWWSTVAGCLSVGSPTFFRSGAQEFSEPGWWKLVHNRPPTLRAHAHKAAAKAKGAARKAAAAVEPAAAAEGLRKRGGRNPVETAMQLKEKRSRTQEAKDIRRAQKEAGGGLGRGRRHPPEALLEKGEVVDFSSVSSSDRTPLSSPSPSPSPDFSAPGTPASHSATPSLLSEADLIPDAMPPQALFHDDEEMAADAAIDPGTEDAPPPAASARKRLRPPPPGIKREADSEDDDEDDFEEEGAARPAAGHEGSERKRSSSRRDKSHGSPPAPRHAPVGPYDERVLRRRLDACPLALAVTPQARRLRRKLLVRQAKRQRGLPLLDIDCALSLAGGVYGAREEAGGGRPGAGRDLRVLDRFQVKASARRGSPSPRLSFGCRLTGADGASEQSVKSPYTSRFLKPYIRRDYESRPPKMRLLAEIRAHAHRREPGWTPEADAPLDYCYVRPNHIPSVNAMCRHGFWPGVDLSECLQYPDFSVVALYKKVVVGFGFMVPDVKYNEAYVSFLLVHPEWRRAGIGTFMIYHLIQTCMGKDVTLHVSASNPAMLLYQKFGFQAEEYILDFYDKYYALDSAECRHAFFLRLRR